VFTKCSLVWDEQGRISHNAVRGKSLLTRDVEGTTLPFALRHRIGAIVHIAWTLVNPAVTGAIVGIRTAAPARDIAGDLRLSKEDVAEIGKWRRQIAA
jgi:hypothetical protein